MVGFPGTMQVCLNGHKITGEYPHNKKDKCPTCGEDTINKCPTCGEKIEGDITLGYGNVIKSKKVYKHCSKCGEPFPWKKKEQANTTLTINSDEILKKIFSKFHTVARTLRQRYNNRGTLDIKDEYDVQDVLKSILPIFFEDIRPEEWTPSYAGKSSRVDFLLKKEEIMIEVKKASDKIKDKEIGTQLIDDIARYKTHPNCKKLCCFVYDPEGHIRNPIGLETDLSKKENNFEVVVFIYPKD